MPKQKGKLDITGNRGTKLKRSAEGEGQPTDDGSSGGRMATPRERALDAICELEDALANLKEAVEDMGY